MVPKMGYFIDPCMNKGHLFTSEELQKIKAIAMFKNSLYNYQCITQSP